MSRDKPDAEPELDVDTELKSNNVVFLVSPTLSLLTLLAVLVVMVVFALVKKSILLPEPCAASPFLV